MEGFFSSSVVSKQPLSLVAKCGACQLFTKCQSPKMPVAGRGLKKILVVGESPGENEDRDGKPFLKYAPAGEKLYSTMRRHGVDLYRDCWITNALICRSPETPTPKQIEWCRPNLMRTVDELQPEIIIPLGGPAVSSLIGGLWREDPGPITQWAGFVIPCQKPNAWIAPTFHPAFVLRSSDDPVVDMMFNQHIAAACLKEGRPWDVVPDYAKKVWRMYNTEEIKFNIRAFFIKDVPVAFDFECTSLKPDSKESRIVCCSMSNGEYTIAFPWLDAVIPAMKEFLLSDVPKIAANAKYEHRWCKAKLGIDVNNWCWDTMLTAHLLDNRPRVTGLKFQAFAMLGVASYDDHIKPWLQGKGGNGQNKIREVDKDSLLLYCGIDAKLEWELAHKQAELMGVSLTGD